MTTRRAVLLAIIVLVTSSASLALAQPTERAPRIGVLMASTAAETKPTLDAFRLGLREAGWVEGRNVMIEYRWADGKPERYPDLAAELVRLNVNVILTSGDQLTLVLKRTTSTIPIVMSGVGNPVAAGIVTSLARPGGNITGLSNHAVDLPAKWLELIKECLPGTKVVAVLRNVANPTHDTFWDDANAGASKLGLRVISVNYRSLADLADAFAAAALQKPSALMVLPDPLSVGQRVHIEKLAEQYRWPTVSLLRESAVAGGFMTYGPSRLDNYRRAAYYVDKILRGAKPADMPVEQARQFELVVNAKTAKTLGIKVPDSVMLRAIEVIE